MPRLVGAGARVHATTRTPPPAAAGPVQWIPLDLTNASALLTTVQALRPDLVIHLGGRVTGAVDPGLVLPTFGTLLASSIALLSAAQASTVGRLVLGGSNDEPSPGRHPRVALPGEPGVDVGARVDQQAHHRRAVREVPWPVGDRVQRGP